MSPNLTGLSSLRRIERSTDQVIKPVNLEALSKWTGHIPRDVVRDMAQIAPMLARLGYDPYANPPNYGNPDPIVINNTHRVSVCTRECERRLRQDGEGNSGQMQAFPVGSATGQLKACRCSLSPWLS